MNLFSSLDFLFTFVKFTALFSTFCRTIYGLEQMCDCGIANTQTSGRIVGGTTVDITLHPWLVMVIRNHELLCAGALLNSRFFITAAHCFNSRTKTSEIKVWLGVSKYPPQLDTEPHVITDINEIISHPEYNSAKLKSDICIARLSTSVSFTARIRPICLPPPNINLDGQIAVLAGWGETSEEGDFSEDLQEVSLPIISLRSCYDVLRHPFLRETNLCAGHITGGRDACQGDSGSPLIWLSNNTWYAAGLVSWGEGCGRVGVYGVYTRISKYVEWINSVVTIPNPCNLPDKIGNEGRNESSNNPQDDDDNNNNNNKSRPLTSDENPSSVLEAALQLQSVINKGCNSKKVNSCTVSPRKGRIVGGDLVETGKYPWMVAIVEVCGEDCFKLLCAGIAIGCRWLLTAAACISRRNLSIIRVAYGVNDLSLLKIESSRLTVIEKVIVTPNQIKHNLVLVKIAGVFNDVACLPPIALGTESFNDGKLMAVGWGRTAADGKISSELREVVLPVVSNHKCSKIFSSVVHKGILCAGGLVNQSICFGDFGGPLIWKNPQNGVEYVVGISSFISPNGCGFYQVPAGFVRLTSYVPWIIAAAQREI